ncbi:MAG: HesA/MoeB/ThiF family protein [Bacilli bacterium]|nr:HesA/MoeB/ThiF family protein [Bacilli bacterium]
MTEFEEKRYSRQILLKGVGIEGQTKLINSKILIVGFGGLGTGVAMFLTRMGIGHLGIIDKDSVDISNIQRQILYDEKDVGVSKIKSGIKKLKQINANLIIDEYDFMLNQENANLIINKYDIIVDCTDNYKTRAIISRACIDNHKTCVFGGVNEFNGFIFTHIDKSPCFECLMGEYEKLVQKDKNNKVVGVIGAMVGIISSMQALEVAKIILNIGSLATDKMIIVDGMDFSTSFISVETKPKCYCNR